MTPQSSFMIVAPIDPKREGELRMLLASMNEAPGRVDPRNALVPFAQLDTVHFARLLIIDDTSVGDISDAYGVPRRSYPLYLAFLGDVDGEADVFVERLAKHAAAGLRRLFSCCEGFAANEDLFRWMKAHDVPSAANYVNWRGRTVRQVREDAALHDALVEYVRRSPAALDGLEPLQVQGALQTFVKGELAAGRLTLSPQAPTPWRWRIADLAHLVGVPLLLLLLSPLLIVAAIVLLFDLRRLEKTDAELCQTVDQAYSDNLARIEDHDVSNQFSAIGSIKPGRTRLWIEGFVLWILDWAARHIYTRGRLARVRTIHFARWVWLDDKQRVMFLSNYDGSLEGYMDDFINKAGFGLNIAFSSGVGYPRTKFLFIDGCSDERKFKEYLRRHQLPTEVWYRAYPGLTAVDLERNARIRQGIESPLTEREAREWLALI